jgi:hypothetical protein
MGGREGGREGGKEVRVYLEGGGGVRRDGLYRKDKKRYAYGHTRKERLNC